MENLDADEELLYKLLSKDFLEKIQYSKKSNLGVYRSLILLSERLGSWELKLILTIAEIQPVKMDQIIDKLSDTISKSTVYRKIPDLITNQIITKDDNDLISLHPDFKALAIIATLYKKIKI